MQAVAVRKRSCITSGCRTGQHVPGQPSIRLDKDSIELLATDGMMNSCWCLYLVECGSAPITRRYLTPHAALFLDMDFARLLYLNKGGRHCRHHTAGKTRAKFLPSQRMDGRTFLAYFCTFGSYSQQYQKRRRRSQLAPSRFQPVTHANPSMLGVSSFSDFVAFGLRTKNSPA